MEAQSESSRRRRRFLPRLAVAVLAGAILYWMTADAPLPFIAAWWRAGEQHWSDPLHRRHRIADWLVLSNRLIGHSREDVVTLLGEPPPTEYFKEWDMVYLLVRSEVSFPSTVSGLCCDWMIAASFARLALLEIDY
jgi:hypothetical protein